ncbi:DUF7619 domain-containing protein [Psychroserpens luteolus]|uniref:DUF7619 domain-containing protein n=1 Tax=Psychroserpens luteolus TaxID=2855840 RepID=UPI001E4C53A9|nr:T9SS type A sorting domain-containing protein [Psychroserpens luteolus]MCD2260539.1 T9SS type A sorting domain-containing protein [Psychroserpens luteolus]
MKRILLFLFLISFYSTIHAQIVNIPDANFKAKLLEADWDNGIAASASYDSEIIDTNGDGEIQVSEAQLITGLTIIASSISDLTGIEAFTNLETLNCRINNLTSLDLTQNTNLISVNCSINSLTTLNVTGLQNLSRLIASSNFYETIDVSQNPNLNELVVDSNFNLTGLNVSQNPNLETLSLSYTTLSTVDVSSNSNLVSLNIRSENFNSLDVTQNSNLESLVCNESILTSLDVTQNLNLRFLNCSANQLTTIDVSQNPNLEYLNCSGNQLTAIDISQNLNLENLHIDQNQLTNIDITQNSNLIWLSCSDNQLTTIDVTQNPNLENLEFGLNQVSTIDLSQNPVLRDLICHSNQLTILDLSQNSNLYSFYCLDNIPLVAIFMKNGNQESLPFFHQNPNLQYICADEDEISYLQSVLGGDSVEINSYCTFVPGGDYNTIFGSLTFDGNNDGCDGNDVSYPGLGVDISDGTDSGTTFSNSNGEYMFYLGTGSYTITPNFENPSWFNTSPLTFTAPFSDLNTTVNQDFCITPNGTHNDVEVVIASTIPAQPGFDASYQIVYKNKGNQVLSGAIDFNYDDSVLDLMSITQSPDAQSIGNLSWNYTDLNPFESRTIDVVFNVNSPMEMPPVNLDDVLNFTATISPISSDETSNDNTFELNQVVVGSFDPNDITCLEGDVVSPERIGEYLHYNIRFENTGTAPATFIVVKDVIDITKYDLSTLQVLNSSHNMITRIEGNEIEFFFEDINLAPSGQGNVLFKIKTLDTLVTGDSVTQQANIYFDFNFPIETNLATTAFENLSVEESEINTVSIYPNPTNGLITIDSKLVIKSVRLYDVQGRKVQDFIISENQTIDISNVSKGVYLLEIRTDSGISNLKILKN